MPNQYSRKYKLDLNVFYREDDISWYLLGAFMTDGCLERQKGKPPNIATLSSVDIEWLESVRDLVCKDIPIVNYEPCGKLKVCSSILCQFLETKGCVPAKSLTLKFPNVPERYLSDFIRGCVDGDGSIYTYNNNNAVYPECYVCGSSLEFLTGMQACLPVSGKLNNAANKPHVIVSTGQVVTHKHGHYRLKFRGKRCKELLSWAYYPGHRLSMPRKKMIADRIVDM